MTTTMERTQNSYTSEQLLQLESLVAKHNEGKAFDSSYYIVDLTGSKQVYFTLFKYTKVVEGFFNPYKYIKNLSINIVQAVEELLIRANNTPVIVCYDDNNNPLLTGFRKRNKEGVPQLHFGKYKGMTVAEIWEKDRNWIIWFNKEYKTNPYIDRFGNMRDPILSTEETIMKAQSRELVNLFWEDWKEKKIEQNKAVASEYIGVLKTRLQDDFTIDKIVKKEEYTMVYLKDSNGNVAYTYGDFDVVVGETYTMKATPTKHNEKLGLKTTYINRVSVLGLKAA